MLKKMLSREIRGSLGRFFALFAITALGVGFFTGLRVTKNAMLKTEQQYLDEQAFFDFRLVSTLGFDRDAAETLREADFVTDAEGAVTQDALIAEVDAAYVLRFLSLPERMNLPILTAGRMPDAPNECIVDDMIFTEKDLGRELRLSPLNTEDTMEAFETSAFRIVGLAASPLYINFERGSTSLGTGTVAGFAYLPRGCFTAEYDTDLYLTAPTTGEVYSNTYQDEIDALEPSVTALAESCADRRYDRLYADAKAELDDAQAEYEDGLAEYWQTRADVEAELADAQTEYDDGLAEYLQTRADVEAEMDDAQTELDDARAELDDGWQQLADAEQTLATETADAERQLADSEAELADALQTLYRGEDAYRDSANALEGSRAAWEAGKAEYDAGMAEYEGQRSALDAQQAALEAAIPRALLEQQLAAIAAQLGLPDAASAALMLDSPMVVAAIGEQTAAALAQAVQGYAAIDAARPLLDAAAAQMAEARQQLDEAEAQLEDGQQQLTAARRELDDGWNRYNAGLAALEEGRAELEAKTEEARAEIEENRQKLVEGEQDYLDGVAALADARAEADTKFAEAEADLTDALVQIADGRAEADAEFADAEAELADAEAQLADARAELDDFAPPDVFVLGRDTNVAYVCFDSDTKIVEGVSRVFPLFFFLVAALVCITTMTRMVEDQRTEIGTLKALGYSSRAIMLKFMAYSGSATLCGSVFGFLFGCWVFPFVLWRVYGMMYCIPREILYLIDWPLALITIPAFLLCMLGATWFSCHQALGEVAAELIRPRTPNAGKKVWLEYIGPLWRRLKFLHKVCARNIFAYHKRLFMMVVGIGGCTALVLTGLGLNDSIQGICENQYGEISLFDYEITFSEAQTPEDQAEFVEYCGGAIRDCVYFSTVSADISANNQTKTVHMVVTDQTLEGYMDFHYSGKKVPMPGDGEAILNNGLARAMHLSVGDRITVYDSEMHPMELTVSGIFENYIYNFLYITPETCRAGWGYVPAVKSAQVLLGDGWEVHASAAVALDAKDVTNININADMFERVDGMLDSLIYVVLLVVSCAGALAFIVLYNLTNINIAERLREIATLKVLGFRPMETAAYVFRENIVLTAFGIVAGIPLGILLHSYVMDKIRIDMITFATRIAPWSYALGIALTFAFAMIVNFIMYFRLEKINMAESLKSNE